jgi:hypothetical protein
LSWTDRRAQVFSDQLRWLPKNAVLFMSFS